jgi:hypothetical protein
MNSVGPESARMPKRLWLVACFVWWAKRPKWASTRSPTHQRNRPSQPSRARVMRALTGTVTVHAARAAALQEM